MAGQASAFSDWGRNSSLYERYASAATEAFSQSDEIQEAKNEWARFFVNSHGDIFETLDIDNSRETLFIDTLYYDFVVDQIIGYIEREFGFSLKNRESTHNTDALPFSFHSLHERILDTESVEGEFDTQLGTTDLLNANTEFLRTLHERIIDSEIRLQLGEYYTPRGVADLAVAELNIADYESETFLDPGCGSGVFLAACIDAKREALAGILDAGEFVNCITETVFGIDLNPVAVKSAKLAYLLALLPALSKSDIETVEVPVFLTDALNLTRTDGIQFDGDRLDLTVDHLVGNPPWVTWDNLSESVRSAWQEWDAERLDLLPHSGAKRRLGHANDDISVPFVWVCLDRYLASGGDASFVLKRGVMTGPAGRLLRSQQANERPVAVRHVHDFNQLRVFGGNVDVNSALYTIQADSDPEFPIAVDSWTRLDGTPEFATAATIMETLDNETIGLVPVDESDPTSSWVREDAERRALGECEHDIRHGIKDDAKNIYSIDRSQLEELEHDHVYPYLRSKHVVKYGLFGHDIHLVPLEKAHEDNERELQKNCPRTYEYLESHRHVLEERSSSWLDDGPFYNLFGLGEYTWSEYKVVWCRLGFKPHFAVVSTVDDTDLGEKPVVPGDHFMFISTDNEYEAHFLCALLNSSPYQKSLKEIASEGKASLSKSVISRLNLPNYSETADERRLAELSMAAHDIVPEHTDVSKRAYNKRSIVELETIQAKIDELVESTLSRRH